jgi:hypothetical protein
MCKIDTSSRCRAQVAAVTAPQLHTFCRCSPEAVSGRSHLLEAAPKNGHRHIACQKLHTICCSNMAGPVKPQVCLCSGSREEVHTRDHLLHRHRKVLLQLVDLYRPS